MLIHYLETSKFLLFFLLALQINKQPLSSNSFVTHSVFKDPMLHRGTLIES